MNTTKQRSGLYLVLASLLGITLAGCGGGSGGGDDDLTRFILRLTNVSTMETLPTSEGSVAVPLSPGVVVIHTGPAPLFSNNEPDRGEGLEEIAEDGDPSVLAANLSARIGTEFEDVIAFNTPVGASEPGPIFPGDSYEIEFEARPGDNLNFATMFIQSNDLFFAPRGSGIPLFDEAGNPVSGDFTADSPIWDAGTEADQELGTGVDQAPRQAGPDTGDEDPDNTVRLIPEPSGVFASLPPDSEVILVEIIPQP